MRHAFNNHACSQDRLYRIACTLIMLAFPFPVVHPLSSAIPLFRRAVNSFASRCVDRGVVFVTKLSSVYPAHGLSGPACGSVRTLWGGLRRMVLTLAALKTLLVHCGESLSTPTFSTSTAKYYSALDPVSDSEPSRHEVATVSFGLVSAREKTAHVVALGLALLRALLVLLHFCCDGGG